MEVREESEDGWQQCVVAVTVSNVVIDNAGAVAEHW